jgi:mannose-1-phosphate guanylyltransferase/phosphomannomutase
MVKGVIMAGGKGTRLRPLTCNMPKPMVPILERPMMAYIVDLLKEHGIGELYTTLFYLPEVIEGYFKDGSEWGVKMGYSIENTPLGTAGSVKNVEKQLDDTFIVISGDALTDIDLTEALKFHRERGSMATLILTRVETPLEYGVVITEKDGTIRAFLEKPSWGEVFSDTVNTGIYILEPSIFNYIPEGKAFDFSKDLFPLLLKEKRPMYGYIADGYWSDIGNLEQYRQSHYDILSGLVKVNIPGEEVGDRIWIGAGSDVSFDAKIESPAWIGPNSIIKPGAHIGEFSIIGGNNIINERASTKRTLTWNNVYMGRSAQLRGAVVCNHVSFKAGAQAFEGAVIGDSSSVGERSTIKPNVRVWPSKMIDDGTTLNMSLIWGGKWSKRLFGTYGVSGLANVEITPEFAAKLGAAYGATLPEPSRVVVSADTKKTSRMLKRAFISGLLSSGVDVIDLGKMTTPVTRYAICTLEVMGGVHIRSSSYEANMVLMEFLDSMGINIDKGTERNIENTFFREDFKRADINRIGELSYLTRVVEEYLKGILELVDVEAIRERKFKIAIDYDEGNLSLTLPTLLEELGCEAIVYEGERRASDSLIDSLMRVSRMVVKEEAALGIIVDPNAERLILIDEEGSAVSDDVFLALISLLVFKSSEDGQARMAVPVTASRIIEEVARKYNAEVIRTRANPRSLMEKVIEEKIFIGRKGLPYFQPVYDGLVSLGKILELMAKEKANLSELLENIPRANVYRAEVECPWDKKGRVMRSLIEEAPEERIELIDGVKIYHEDGWALVLPDSDKPVFHIYSEASSMEIAEELGQIYGGKIGKLT